MLGAGGAAAQVDLLRPDQRISRSVDHADDLAPRLHADHQLLVPRIHVEDLRDHAGRLDPNRHEVVEEPADPEGAILADLEARNGGLHDLLHLIVTSDIFRHK